MRMLLPSASDPTTGFGPNPWRKRNALHSSARAAAGLWIVCADRRSGQGTVEWIALILLVSTALAALAWLVGLRLPGMALAHSIAERMVCAVRLTEDCRNEPALRAAHGPELAALLRAHAPALLYEDGMTALPVDFRR